MHSSAGACGSARAAHTHVVPFSEPGKSGATLATLDSETGTASMFDFCVRADDAKHMQQHVRQHGS